jgi:FlgD Ig-like domain
MRTLLLTLGVLSTLLFFEGVVLGEGNTVRAATDTQVPVRHPDGATPELISFQPGDQQVPNGYIGVFADNAGLSCNLPGSAGAVYYYFVHVNALGATASQWAAPKPSCLTGTRLADLPVFAINLGTTETGITIGYGSCKVGTFLIMTALYEVTSATDCCPFSVVADPYLASGRIEVPDCDFNLTYGEGLTGIVNSNPTCQCNVDIVCSEPEPTLTLLGYRSVSREGARWTVQVEVLNSGPGMARQVSATMQQDIPWLYIPDAGCYYGELMDGESSWGENDQYLFDLTNYPGGSFNVWFDVGYTDECNRSHLVRLDPEFDLNQELGPTHQAITTCGLGQNYPNPFNPTTTIPFSLSEDTDIRLSVFDSQGKLVRVLVSESMSAGSKEVVWDGRDMNGTLVSSGLYFCQLKASGTAETRKLLLLK